MSSSSKGNNQEVGSIDLVSEQLESSRKSKKGQILNYLLRSFSLLNRVSIDDFSMTDKELAKLASSSGHGLNIVREIVEDFLRRLRYYREFLANIKIKWHHDPATLFRKVRIYLHKTHKLAPVFDYNRAKVNLKKLHAVFWRCGRWRQISTQLAIVIYLTDRRRKGDSYERNLLKDNVRAITNCSAYAFYRTKENLKIK